MRKQIQTLRKRRRWWPTLGLVIGCAGGLCPDVAAQQRNSSPSATPGWVEPRLRSDDSGGSLEWVFFPVNPPVLGAEVAVVAASRQTDSLPILRAFLTDPFFPQIASRVVLVAGEQQRSQMLTQEEFVHLDSFLSLRAALVAELYDRSEAMFRLEPGARAAAFGELARTQEARLAEMERSAEWLRQAMSKVDPWSEFRTWRLNRGSLRQPRDKTYVLEFQVARAAAYYQPGFSPGQRRLIRELAIEMSETIATRGRTPAKQDLMIMFFSPETSRIIRPTSRSPEFEALVDGYLAEKRRLKDELREVIYETDAALFEYTRSKQIDDLASAQAGAIDRLEDMAEQIRRELVRIPEYRRYRGSTKLDVRLEERLQAFSDEVTQLEKERAAFVRERITRAREKARTNPEGPVLYESAAHARSVFEIEQGERLMAHERRAEALFADLVEALPPEEAIRLNGSAEVAVREFLERRAEQDAYADYDLAALEPGLSPAQRRLLLAAAMARLRQVMLPPEIQPTDAPGTLIGLGL